MGCTHKRKRGTADKEENFFNYTTNMSQVSFKTFFLILVKLSADRNHRCVLSFFSQPRQEEDEHMQRPEVRDEDLDEAKNKLGMSGPAKSKTMEVMDECGEDTLINTHGDLI